MAIACKCDRCNNYFDFVEGRHAKVRIGYYDEGVLNFYETGGYDLCPACYDALRIWLHISDKKTK